MSQPDEQLVERLFRYLAITSQSDARAETLPSTPGQRVLADLLASELAGLGLDNIHIDANGVLTALRRGSVPHAPCIGFVAHLDTVDVGLSPDIHPQRLRWEGRDLCLNAAQDIWLLAAEHPELAPYVGEEVVFGDGTSVLGADNKAAIATVMTLLDRLRDTGLPVGDIAVAFVPDEEIGLRGAKVMELARFPARYAFTIDSCERGELVWETFNAAKATIAITGVTAHPMSAKGVMVNPVRVAADLIAQFDPLQTPEHTDLRDGYWWFNQVEAGSAEARLQISIRDFDTEKFAARKRHVGTAVETVRALHPRARIECLIEDQYGNIAAALGDDRSCIELVEAAFAEIGIAPKVIAMRGGTDGSALSARGIPTPNYFTGALNFHSRYEFLPISAFRDAYRVTERIVTLAGARTTPAARAA
ncbi:peptidase T [Lichenicoccus roseus]|uniref:Peptidase T n=1 Tax=Lichenicoccus roseus TaxID=2683649 RepID=A0A5R9J8S2_9PROT|nr:peptidase T [Lichenicoccus roseus]TLU71776.1 peptidase T [Lichenicoccus roseus]